MAEHPEIMAEVEEKVKAVLFAEEPVVEKA